MEELTYQNVHPDNIQAAAQRVRQFFKGPTHDEAEKLKQKCLAVQSGELTGQQAVFSVHEQILLPYLLPWACQKPEMLDFFLESVQDEEGHLKSRVEEFWGDSWQKAVKAFFEHFQDTASFRMLGRMLYMTKDKEAMADKQPVERPYLKLLSADSRDTRLCQDIIRDGLIKAAQKWSLSGPDMLGGTSFFRSGYVTVVIQSYLSNRAEYYRQKKLLKKCIDFLNNRSGEEKEWLSELYDTWCMSKVDRNKPKDSLRELEYVEKFKAEMLKDAKLKEYIKEALQPSSETKRAIEKLCKATVKVDEEAKAARERKSLAKPEQSHQEYHVITTNAIEVEGRGGQEKQAEKRYLALRPDETPENVLSGRSPAIVTVEPPERGAELVKTEEPTEKPGLFKNVWQKIKSWFSFDKKEISK